MIIRFEKSCANGYVTAPPSKSMAQRALICACYSKTPSVIRNVPRCSDIDAVVGCLKAIGATICQNGDTYTVSGPEKETTSLPLMNCKESAATLRFLIPVSTVLGNGARFTGSKRLLERIGFDDLDFLRSGGIRVLKSGNSLYISGKLQPGSYTVDGSLSSQWLSGLLLSLPFCGGSSVITVKNGQVSKPYADCTLFVLKKFGVDITNAGYERFYINGVGNLSGGNDYTVEGDWSNAAFLKSLSLTGGKVCVGGLDTNSIQGDRRFDDYFEIMKNAALCADCTDTPDLVPVLMSCSALLNGCTLSGISRLRLKESDRVAVMMRELGKFGVKSELSGDKVSVFPSDVQMPAVPLICENDHRMAMALSLLLCKTGGVLDGAECVCKSYPTFFDDLKNLGINLFEISGENL